jgi:hypothetical protein
MVNVQSPCFARPGQKVELVILNREWPCEVLARYSDGDVPFRVVKGKDGLRRIKFVMPATEEVMFRVKGQTDGPRLVRVRAEKS